MFRLIKFSPSEHRCDWHPDLERKLSRILLSWCSLVSPSSHYLHTPTPKVITPFYSIDILVCLICLEMELYSICPYILWTCLVILSLYLKICLFQVLYKSKFTGRKITSQILLAPLTTSVWSTWWMIDSFSCSGTYSDS